MSLDIDDIPGAYGIQDTRGILESYQDNELLYGYPPEYGTPPADWQQTAQPLFASSSSGIGYADFVSELLTLDPPSTDAEDTWVSKEEEEHRIDPMLECLMGAV